jgi:serine/threonine-protein kinase
MAGIDPPLERLGKYQITEVLGTGAMGVVYKGFDPNIRRTVAIKTIRKELIDDDRAEQMIARFRNEAQAAGRLSHPAIVAVYDYGEDDALSYIAMEYVQGNPLREYFNRKTEFAERDIVSIMVQLLDALAYSHEQGVVHRDIKPASLTQIGAVMGTPGYMAPEQYAGEAIDWRADLFSSGVVLYQLLTGERPFTGTAESVAYRICHENPTPPSQACPGRGWERYDSVIATAMAKHPDARFQTAGAFRDVILNAYAAPVSPAVSEETVISDVVTTVIRIEPTRPSQWSGGAKAPATTLPPAHWDALVLKQVETQLARFVGPVARVMVKRAATDTTDIAALYALLADRLPNGDDKRAFLAGQAGVTASPSPAPRASTPAATKAETGARTTQIPITPEAVEQAARLLATYLGPIAKVVVKKASAKAIDRRQFYQLLAESLSNEEDRKRFLGEVGATSL